MRLLIVSQASALESKYAVENYRGLSFPVGAKLYNGIHFGHILCYTGFFFIGNAEKVFEKVISF